MMFHYDPQDLGLKRGEGMLTNQNKNDFNATQNTINLIKQSNRIQENWTGIRID